MDQACRSSDVPGNLMRPGPGEPRPSLSEDTENLRPLDWALSISQACIGTQSLLIGYNWRLLS